MYVYTPWASYLCIPWTIHAPEFSGQNTGWVAIPFPGIFQSTRIKATGLQHCRLNLYQLSLRDAQECWSGLSIPSQRIFLGRRSGEDMSPRAGWIPLQLSYQEALKYINLPQQTGLHPLCQQGKLWLVNLPLHGISESSSIVGKSDVGHS